jgi:hypothetical protein
MQKLNKRKTDMKSPDHCHQQNSGSLGLCRQVFHLMETGEKIKRGCGRRGLMPTEVGWKCFYCGNYIYRTSTTLIQLWFHFRLAREYWRASSRGDQEFVNGVPVAGNADPLPGRLLADLDNPRPPRWFRYYILYDEKQFQDYMRGQGVIMR